jgi:hypothetical protein
VSVLLGESHERKCSASTGSTFDLWKESEIREPSSLAYRLKLNRFSFSELRRA